MKKIGLMFMLMVLVLMFLSVPVFAKSVTQTIAAAPPVAGIWTSQLAPLQGSGNGYMNIGVYGVTWSGTVFLQRNFQSTGWVDVTSFTSNTQKALLDKESGVAYRIGIKTGGYTSGSVAVRLSN